MNAALEGVEASLACLKDLHAQLLSAAEAKREAMIRNNLEAMEEILQAEQELIARVEEEEAKRQQYAETLRRELGIEANPVKLVMIVEKLPAAEGERLSRLREGLKEVIEKLRYRSRQNAELIRVGIDHANDFLALVAEAVQGGSRYGRKGKIGGSSLRLLDKRA